MQTVCFQLGLSHAGWLWIVPLLLVVYIAWRERTVSLRHRQLLRHMKENHDAIMVEIRKNERVVIELKTLLNVKKLEIDEK